MWTFFDDQVEDFSSKREILEFAINKEGSCDIKNREISLICENTSQIFENMDAESGSLPLKVGEFTCMIKANLGNSFMVLSQ